MNTRQEIVDCFDGHVPELPPPAVFTQTGTVSQMDACGASWPEANFDPDAMARLALAFPDRFGFATVRVPFCLTVEAERLGCTILEGRRDTQPSVPGSRFMADGIPDLPPEGLMDPEEFASGGRCATVADVAARISRERGDLFVTAGMFDPVGVASMLLGAENTVMGGFMEPERVAAWIDGITPLSCAYAERLSESADNVLVIAGAMADLFSPEMFDTLSVPYVPRVFASVRSSFSTLHSCGDTFQYIDRIAAYGADALSLEASHDPRAYLDAVGDRCLMVGAVDPMTTLLTGSPGSVVAEARRDAELGFGIITPECGIAPYTPDENLLALARYRGDRGDGDGWWARPDLNRRPSGYEPDALPA